MAENHDKLGDHISKEGTVDLLKSTTSHVEHGSRTPGRRAYKNLISAAFKRVPRHEVDFLVGTSRGAVAQTVIRCESIIKPTGTASSPLASGNGNIDGGNDGDGGGKSYPPEDPAPVLSEDTNLDTQPPTDPRSPEELDSDREAHNDVILSSKPSASQIAATKSNIVITDSRDLEEWQRRALSEYPYKSREEYEAITKSGKLLQEGVFASDLQAMLLLEKAGLLGHQKYNEVYESGAHGYSHIPEALHESEFMKRFMERIEIGEDSVILDVGCGIGNSSIIFAKKGARVIALDSSELALKTLKQRISGKDYEDRIQIQHEKLSDYLGNPNYGITDVYGESIFHLFPPRVLPANIFPKINEILRLSGGYLGYSMKTVKSDSASKDLNFRLTSGDGYNCSLQKRFGIFKMFPDEHMVERFAKDALVPVDMAGEIVRNYDLQGQREVFRYIIARAKAAQE